MARAVLHYSSINRTGFECLISVLSIDPDFEYVLAYGRLMSWDRGKSVRQRETT